MSTHAAQKEFLLEIGTEEIPAWMMESALADMKRLLEEVLARHRLTEAGPVSLEVYGTPRRLVAYCPNLVSRQPDSVEQVQGPPKRVAFDAEGKPTPAAVQFAAKMGTKPEKLQAITTLKGEYLAFRKITRGRPTAEVLRDLVPQVVLGISFPRTMYWEGKAGPRFIRPIRSLLVLYGGRVIPCSVGSVRSGHSTFGHRRLGKSRLPVRDFASYREVLRNNFVLLDPQERRARIVEQIQSLLASANGFRWKQNEELLETLVYLTEYPTPLVGEFDRAFLALPEEVLITVMRGHQKYFAVEQPDSSLAPRFIAVMNLDADRTGAIRHGHERVLRARFNDARFFWETDGKIRLEERLEMLKHVTFQSQLGSYYDKALRMQALANLIVLRLRDAGTKVEPDKHPAIVAAAKLAKCDLTTNLVKEFTELQGVVGGLYAEREGLSKEIATAIYDHYRPQSMEDSLPRSLAGDIVSLADRMDTLVGCFGVGLVPSGSKDPFGLRRVAQGVIRILAEKQLPLTLDGLVGAGCEAYAGTEANKPIPTWSDEGARQPLTEFLEDRLRYYLREVRGFAYDEVNAVLAAGSYQSRGKNYEVIDILHRLEAVAKIRPTENFEPLAAAFKRIKNILRQAEEKGLFSHRNFEEKLLEPGPETELYHLYRSTAQQVAEHKQKGDYFTALEAIASLRPVVDRFFDKVLVMAPEADLCENRLTLLANLLSEFSTIADFSEIVPKEEAKIIQ
ncbi:MAG: glycine--tRNA ligase subunit beta [Acidobacteria bacterium]|nr:glycine--tRNA ligase subunit beta [Acidobacteriota bacterium]